jgi:P4 family phage/plasmid primase-like protien
VSADYPEALVEAAKDLMARGRKVFGISSNKIPFPNCENCKGQSSAEHRAVCACINDPYSRCHGFYAATDDLNVIKQWVSETPDMHLAVATGRTSGVFVFDYDPRNGGDVSFQELMDEHDAFDTEANTTPNGGKHFIFQLPNFDVHAISGKLWPGIDIKGEGGYHLVPPTPGYETEDTQEAKPAPKWLRDAIFNHQAKFKWSEGSRNLRAVERQDYNPDAISEPMGEQVQKTVDYWVGKIRTAPHGHQNTYLYTAARVLFSLAFHGVLDEDQAQQLLEDAAAQGNHPRDRARLAIDSGRRAADENPDPLDDALNDDRDTIETFQMDDIGNANRVVFWKGGDIRYDPDRERFYTFDRKKWVPAKEGRVLGLVEDVIQKIPSTEALFYSDSTCPPSELNKSKSTPRTYRQVFLEWTAKQRFAGKITATAVILKGREALWTTGDDFDIDPYMLNVNNGVVDLRTGALHPHNRSYMATNISGVDYDPTASCPEFCRFLEMTQPNPEHRRYLQRLMGLTLIGEVRDQIFALHIGSGGNGKGVFLDTCSYVLGEYATTGQRDSFVRKSNSNRIPADIASFEGKRIVLVDELNDNQKMDTALLKDVTGGGKIKAEAKNVNPWEYTPKFTLHFRTNHMPDLPTDRSIVRRFRPVRWSVEPTSEQWDSFTSPHHSTPFNYLTKKEASGILNWMLEGTRDYLENGLDVPIDLQLDAIMMLEENDPFLIFMNQCTDESVGAKKDGTVLYKAFRDWYSDHYTTGNVPSSKSLWVDVREGKYKGRWNWDMERGRMVFKDLEITNRLAIS